MNNISFCMIVKDEEEVIEECLNSIKTFINNEDEIIVVDTGSKDKTKEIALKYTEKVFDFEWCNDFSKARNYSISKAKNDWVLIIDADEVVENLDSESLKCFIKECHVNNKQKIGRIKRINIFEDNYGEKKYIERVNRLFNRNYFEYDGIIHEQIISNNQSESDLENVDLVLNHIGYMKEVINRTNKIERNINLLKEALKEKEDPYIYYQLGKSFFIGKNYNEAVYNFEKALELQSDLTLEYVMDLVLSYGYGLINSVRYLESLKLESYQDIYFDLPDYNFLMGLIYMNNAKFKEAIDSFYKCIGEKEGNIEGINSYLAFYNIGVIYECLGHKNEAISLYEKCGEYIPAKKRLNSI